MFRNSDNSRFTWNLLARCFAVLQLQNRCLNALRRYGGVAVLTIAVGCILAGNFKASGEMPQSGISVANGIEFPHLPNEIESFDGGKYFEAIRVKPATGKLDEKDQKLLRGACLQVGAIQSSVIHHDSFFSTSSPIWPVLVANFAILNDSSSKVPLINGGKVSVLELYNRLHK